MCKMNLRYFIILGRKKLLKINGIILIEYWNNLKGIFIGLGWDILSIKIIIIVIY